MLQHYISSSHYSCHWSWASVAILHNILFSLLGSMQGAVLRGIYSVLYVWCAACLLCVFGGLDHPAPTCQGVSEEEARVGGGGPERAQGREEGHTHEPTVHPASGPHLELDTASPRAGRGNFRGEKRTSGDEREKLSVTVQEDETLPPAALAAVRG